MTWIVIWLVTTEVNDLIQQARANNGIVNNTGPIKFVASKFTWIIPSSSTI